MPPPLCLVVSLSHSPSHPILLHIRWSCLCLPVVLPQQQCCLLLAILLAPFSTRSTFNQFSLKIQHKHHLPQEVFYLTPIWETLTFPVIPHSPCLSLLIHLCSPTNIFLMMYFLGFFMAAFLRFNSYRQSNHYNFVKTQ